MTSSSRPRPVDWRALFLGAFATGLAGVVYLNSLRNPFVLDDFRTVVDNGSIHTFPPLLPILLHDLTRPMVNLSYAVDRAWWGQAPFGFHLTNVMLHMCNVALLFVVAKRLVVDQRASDPDSLPALPPDAARASTAAFAAAALFAVHPMMTGAVGYVSARADVLCTTLIFLAFLCGRHWIRQGGGSWWFATVVLWTAAMLTKETAIVLPLLLFSYERLLLWTDTRRQRTLRRLHLPLFGLALCAGLIRLGIFIAVERGGAITLRWRALLDEAIMSWHYVRLLLLPAGQAIVHEMRPVQSLFEARAAGAVIGVIASVVVAWRWRGTLRDGGTARFGALWFVAALVPTAALAVVDRAALGAEHRVYLASCGLFLTAGTMVAWLGARLSGVSRRLRVLGSLAFLTVLLSLGSRAFLRNVVWSDPVALWTEAVDRAPDSWVPRAVLGETLHEAGRHREAIGAYLAAIARNPGDDVEYLNLAVCLSEEKRTEEAHNALKALEQVRPKSPFLAVGLGAVSMTSGDVAAARQHFQDALAVYPDNVMALRLLAGLEERSANPAEALRYCEELRRYAAGSLATDECVRRNRALLAMR